MPAIHVRNLDDAVITALKARAARNNRSLQKELVAILERAAFDPKVRRFTSRLHTVRVGGAATFSRDEIYGDDDDGR